VVVGVTHVKCMLVNNSAPLEIGLVRIVPIPHLLMSSCLEKLVFPCVGSLLEAIGIMEMELPPQLNTYLSKLPSESSYGSSGFVGLFLLPVDFLITGAFVLFLG
jgi:hypothetical protein